MNPDIAPMPDSRATSVYLNWGYNLTTTLTGNYDGAIKLNGVCTSCNNGILKLDYVHKSKDNYCSCGVGKLRRDEKNRDTKIQ